MQTSFVQAGNPYAYLPAGQDVAVNDPLPGRWRVRITSPLVGPSRIRIDFNRRTGELSPGQAKIDASSMDFFTDLNRYIPNASKHGTEAVSIDNVISNPGSLSKYDSLVVVNNVGRPSYLRGKLGLSADEAKRYFAGLKSYASNGGNLVLTDSALGGLPELGIGKASDIKARQALEAGRYEFKDQCNRTPLTKTVCLPGTAGGTSRQAAETTPLGYSPDLGFDSNKRRVMPEWYIREAVWNSGSGCPSEDCTEGLVGPGAGLGEQRLGKGRVRIAGVMFPDPNYNPGKEADMRFGLESYALTFSAWQIFLNLVNHRR